VANIFRFNITAKFFHHILPFSAKFKTPVLPFSAKFIWAFLPISAKFQYFPANDIAVSEGGNI
jgi:hypothetical protein